MESKSDERILGEGQFVEEVLREAEEELARRTGYEYQGTGLTQSAVSRAVQRGEKLSVEMKITFLAGNA